MRRLLSATLLAILTLALAPAAEGWAAKNVELLHGDVRAVGHDASGRAAVVLTGARRVLTLRRFSIDPGPRVRVWLVPRSAKGDGQIPKDYKDLGTLKGNRGNQQYAIPAGVDLRRYTQRDLLVRAVHADPRAGEPRALVAMRLTPGKLLAPPLVVAHARGRALVLGGRRRAGLLEHDRARRRCGSWPAA